MRTIALITTLSFLFVGCANYTNHPSPLPQTPEWLTNMNYIQGKRSAVGCANIHIRGVEEQKKLAISKGIEQIALQKSTTIDVATYRQTSNNALARDSKTSSLQSTKETLSTKVLEMHTYADGRICVLVVEE